MWLDEDRARPLADARQAEADRQGFHNRKPLDAIVRGDYRCRCGAPAAFRIVHPSRDITQAVACFIHLFERLTDLLIDGEQVTAPRIQGVVHHE